LLFLVQKCKKIMARTRRMAQGIQHLHNKREALSSNASINTNNKRIICPLKHYDRGWEHGSSGTEPA
jgi:hypothetical protein